VQSSEVDAAGLQQGSVVDNVAKTDVEVAIHALQRADDDAILWRQNAKRALPDIEDAGALQKRLCEGSLLAGLT